MIRALAVMPVLCLLTAHAGAADEPPIIGGSATSVGDYPAVVVLIYDIGDEELGCTGTLIDPEWVMTAAHCVDPVVIGVANQAAVTAAVKVHLGTIDVHADPGTVVVAQDTIPDPVWSTTNHLAGDVGLVHLKTPVTNITPQVVNWANDKTPIGLTALQIGYGTTEVGGLGGFGKEYAIDDRHSVDCTLYAAQLGSATNDEFLCFDQSDMMGECEGDSGGPSMMTIAGQLAQIAITSFGDMECDIVGANTRPSAVKQFVLSHVPGIECTVDAQCNGSDTCFHGVCVAAPGTPGGLGSACAGGSDCDSEQCASGPGSDKLCVIACAPGSADACPDGFDCLANGSDSGACWPSDGGSGGCCDAGSRGAPTTVVGIGLVVLALRRRRR